ncbi:MAG: RNA-binding transcriptional accessory protein [Rhodospirillales bacterium]|nr:RNA-binding transcriptional accessory protein [Rhodospirillales bacterium]MBR9818431.1 RNA-binding transcriptional accessory protein [Rhodospirillales bacterium]
MRPIPQRIAEELSCRPEQVIATIEMLNEGSTVPFIARYRKEKTGGLDDTQLRTLEERLRYLTELEERRSSVLESIREQEKLTPELEKAINEADTKTRLEDLYLPYKKKRRTKAQIAREAGLEPLADDLYGNPNLDPETEAAKYVDAEKGVEDTKAALDGARQILMERFAEDADLVAKLRDLLWNDGEISASVIDGKQTEGAKFSDYFEHSEKIKTCPSHRALALFRGRNENILQLKLTLGAADEDRPRTEQGRAEIMISAHVGIADRGRAADKWLVDTVRWTWRVKLSLSIELDLFGTLRDRAEEDAIKVFADNLKDLLLAAPAGQKATMGLDPGVRTGVKVAVIDATGKMVDTATVYPFQPRNDVEGALNTLAALAARHKIELIAIGNGTYSRETDELAGQLLKRFPALKATKVIVNESGASIYSASQFAAEEFPDLDVSLRGAVSIARRLQDPLAELVKIEPKSIGVGQYQHDVSETKLAKSLDAVVEDCVNGVGVDLNTASIPLLTRVAGLSETLARNIVGYRDINGAFRSRADLRKVERLGPKAFEQCAGFLRIRGGENPLDASAVHPEAYKLVERISTRSNKPLAELIGDSPFIKTLRPDDYADDVFGVPTIRDILAELDKPGRDPRPEFKTAKFTDGVNEIKDLKTGMKLEGTVTNVTNFGAFVDIGVHQDGLVHISQLADKFVSDPREVVKAGQIVSVTVMEVDAPRKRIGLSMKSAPDYEGTREKRTESRGGNTGGRSAPQSRGNAGRGNQSSGNYQSNAGNDGGAMAAALKAAMERRK